MPAQHTDDCFRASRERFEQARALKCDTAAQIESAVRLLNEALTLRPTMTQSLLLRATLLTRLCDYNAAITDLTVVAQLEDDGRFGSSSHGGAASTAAAAHASRSTAGAMATTAKIDRSRLANVYGSRGHVFTLMNKHQEALMDFARAASIDNEAVWQYEIARTHMRLGNNSHARHYLECVLHDRDGQPRLPEMVRHKALLSLGSCLLNTSRQERDMAAALDLYMQAAVIVSTTAVHALIGIASYRLQNYRACLEYFASIIDSKSAVASSTASCAASMSTRPAGTCSASLMVTSYVYLAVCAFRLGDYAEALHYMGAAILMEKDNHTLLFLRACMEMHQGLLDGAVRHISQAIQLCPSEARYFYLRGLLYMTHGDEDAAEQAFGRVHVLQPHFYDGMVQLGILAQRRGHVYRALDWYHKALQCDSRSCGARLRHRCRVATANDTSRDGAAHGHPLERSLSALTSSSSSSSSSSSASREGVLPATRRHARRRGMPPARSSATVATHKDRTRMCDDRAAREARPRMGARAALAAHSPAVPKRSSNDVDANHDGAHSVSVKEDESELVTSMSSSLSSGGEKEDEEARLLEQMGLLYTDMDCHDLAIRYFTRCTLLCPRSRMCWFRLGVSQLCTGNNWGALRSFDMVLDDLSVDRPVAISGKPEERTTGVERRADGELLRHDAQAWVVAEAMHARAVTLFKLNRYDEAREWANRAIACGSCSSAQTVTPSSHRAQQKQQSRATEASTWVRCNGTGAGVGGASHRYYAIRAEIHYALADYEACVRDASVVVDRCHPAHAAVHYIRAAAYCTMGRLPEAIADFDTAVVLRPELRQDETFCYAHGVTLARDGQHAASLLCFDDAIALSQDRSSSSSSSLLLKPRTVFFHERAKVRQALHDVAGAIEDFDTVLSRQPHNFNALVRRAFALKALGRFEEAANDLLRAEQDDSSKALAQLQPYDTYDMEYIELCPPGAEQEEDDDDDASDTYGVCVCANHDIDPTTM